jgi:glycosyltransferase involved in cell wall biosynthesis
MSDKINIIILGGNYFGQMASGQRMRNLFEPILNTPGLSVSNIIVNGREFELSPSKVEMEKLNYSYKNIFSIAYYFFKGSKYLIKRHDKNALNVIYHFDYPSIEDILFLKIAQILDFKIVYDISENIEHYDLSKSSLRMKFKNYTSRKLLKQVYKNGALCFAISTQLVDFFNKIKDKSIVIIHLPISVDVELVNNFKKKKKSKSEHNRIQVFYGGTFGIKDGFEYLLKGFEMACERIDTIDLILTGSISKEMKGKIQLLINSSKWKDRIFFLGYLSTSEYYSAMSNADILCMCRINNEYANFGFPFKLGEYLASGNAIIATNIGDVSHYLTNKVNALLIQPESELQICDAMLMLSQDSQLRIKLGNAAYDTALEHFSSQKISKLLFENIQSLTNQH